MEKRELKGVLYVPDLCEILISVNVITENGGEIVFKGSTVSILKDGEIVLQGEKQNNGLYVVNLENNEKGSFLAHETDNAYIIHRMTDILELAI